MYTSGWPNTQKRCCQSKGSPPAEAAKKLEPNNLSNNNSINATVITEEIAEYKVDKKYLLDKPKGVRGRSSDNTFITEKLNWAPTITLKEGLEKTYKWIFNEISKKENISKFTKH